MSAPRSNAFSFRIGLVVLPLLLLGCDSGSPVDSARRNGGETEETCNIPRSLLTTGCEGADCIPSIDNLTTGDDRFREASSIEGREDERVVGLLFGEQPLAISLDLLRNHEVLNFDSWEEGPIVQVMEVAPEMVVFWSRGARSAMAFETSRSFSVRADEIRDDSTGSVWALDGRAVEGPLEGTRLDPVEEAYVAFQWAWTNFHPETRLWSPSS